MNKPQTAQALLEAIRATQIVPDMETVEACCLEASSVARAAKTLIKKGLLSTWQASQLLAGATALRLGNVVLVDELPPWEAGRTFVGRDPKARLLRIKLLPGQLDQAIWEKVKAHVPEKSNVEGCEPFRGAHQAGERQALLSLTSPGVDLRTYASQNDLSLPQATQILQQIGRALQCLHDSGAYHGLLMQEKIHIDAEQQVKLLDTELAPILPFLDIQGPSPHAEERRQQAIETRNELGGKRADWAMLGQLGLDLLESIQDSDEKKRLRQLFETQKKTGECSADQWALQICKSTPAIPNFTINTDPPAQAKPAEQPGATTPNTSPRPKAEVPASDQPTEPPPEASADPKRDGSPDIAPDKRSIRPAKTRTTDSADSAEPEPTAAKESSPKRLVLVLAAVVGVLAVGGAIYGASVWLGGDQAAQNDKATAPTAGSADESLETDPETNPIIDLETNPLPESDPTPPGTSTAEGQTPDSGSSATAAPVDETAPDTANESTPEARAAPQPEPTPEPEGTPAPEPKPEPGATPEPEPKPEPQPDPKPAPPPPPPFAQMPTSLTLLGPEEAGAGPQTLGQVAVDASTLFASLRGGGTAIRGKDRFIMQNAENGTAVGKWEFQLVDRNDQATTVATLELQDQSLVFQWTASDDPRLLGQLQNCAVSFSSGSHAHVLALREALEVPAPLVNLERGVNSVDWDVPLPPDPDAVYVELAGLSGPLPEQRVIPERPATVSSEAQWVLVGTPQKPVMSVMTQWDVKRGINLELSTHLFPATSTPDHRTANKTRLNKKTLESAQIKMAQDLDAALSFVNRFSDAERNRLPANQRPAFDDARQKAQQNYQVIQTQAVAVQELLTLLPQIHNASGLEFRVYHNADQTEVDLVRTPGFAALIATKE